MPETFHEKSVKVVKIVNTLLSEFIEKNYYADKRVLDTLNNLKNNSSISLGSLIAINTYFNHESVPVKTLAESSGTNPVVTPVVDPNVTPVPSKEKVNKNFRKRLRSFTQKSVIPQEASKTASVDSSSEYYESDELDKIHSNEVDLHASKQLFATESAYFTSNYKYRDQNDNNHWNDKYHGNHIDKHMRGNTVRQVYFIKKEGMDWKPINKYEVAANFEMLKQHDFCHTRYGNLFLLNHKYYVSNAPDNPLFVRTKENKLVRHYLNNKKQSYVIRTVHPPQDF